jgi:hypothetical protein
MRTNGGKPMDKKKLVAGTTVVILAPGGGGIACAVGDDGPNED